MGKIFEKLAEINKNGTSLLVVELNVTKPLEIYHRAYVFEIGTIALEGSRESLIKDERIKKILIGG